MALFQAVSVRYLLNDRIIVSQSIYRQSMLQLKILWFRVGLNIVRIFIIHRGISMNISTSKLLHNSNSNKKERALLEVKVELERREEEIILRLILNKVIKMIVAVIVAVKMMKSIRKSINSFIIIIIISVGMRHFKRMHRRSRRVARKNDRRIR